MRVGHLGDEGWTSVGCGLDIWGVRGGHLDLRVRHQGGDS